MRRTALTPLLLAIAAALAPPTVNYAGPRRRGAVVLRALPVVSTQDQLVMFGRLVVAAASGSALGFERIGRGRAKKRDSPVGVRTMALVSMGSACFTVAGLLVPNGDAARIAAAAATGVGFLGAGVITTSNGVVNGLTTAASIWLAAALGVASGAGLSLFVTMATAQWRRPSSLRYPRRRRGGGRHRFIPTQGCAMFVLRMPHRFVGRRAAREFERDSIPPKDIEPDP